MADARQTGFVFQRIEKKYLLTKDKYEKFLKAIEPYMSIDEYGLHTICNIYYDTDTYDLIRHSIEKPTYKEKLRLRSYGVPSKRDKVYLEIKKKYDGVVYKRRISLSLEEAERYLNHRIRPGSSNQIFNEIDYFMDYYNPTPKLYLAYDRVAYFGKEDRSFRLTFDHNIRSREVNIELDKGDFGKSLLQEDEYLMEIKIPMALPIWMARILSDLEIYPTSFSKYGNIYKEKIREMEQEERRMDLCLQAY